MSKYFHLCHHCRGTRRIETEWNADGDCVKSVLCGECDGMGIHLTEEGDELRHFLEVLTASKEKA